jgi:hypothetical protein
VDARRLAQFGRRPTRPPPHRQQQANRFVPQPAQRERERARRRNVKPLAVVNCNQHRANRGGAAHERKEPRGHGTAIRRAPARLLDHERDVQRAALGRREARPHIPAQIPQQIAEARKRKLLLLLGRLGYERQTITPRASYRFTPDRRLPNPGLAHQDQRRRTTGHRLEKGIDSLDFGSSPDQPATIHPLDRTARNDQGEAAEDAPTQIGEHRPARANLPARIATSLTQSGPWPLPPGGP